MGDVADQGNGNDRGGNGDDRGLTRRDALKKGALIGGAAFVIPVVGSISMSSASAQSPSGGGGSNPQPIRHHRR